MATYYWVGGSGTWDNSSTTNWSATSGGSGGAGVPTTADDVVFDVNSGSFHNVTIVAPANCKSFLATSTAQSIFAGDLLRVSGSFQLLSNPGGAIFDVYLRLVPATASGIVFSSVASIFYVEISDVTGIQTTITLNSNIISPNVRLQIGLVPSGTFSITCNDFQFSSSPVPKIFGSASFPLTINITPTNSSYVFRDGWANAGDSILNTTVNVLSSVYVGVINSDGGSSVNKDVNLNINGNTSVFEIQGQLVKNLTLTNSSVEFDGDLNVSGNISLIGTSAITDNAGFRTLAFQKKAGSPNVSRTVTVAGTSQWTGVGFENEISAGTDTVTVSGNFGTLANPIDSFISGALTIGSSIIYSGNVSLQNSATLVGTVFNVINNFNIASGASLTGTYTVNVSSAVINTRGVLVPNLNITGSGAFNQSLVTSNLLATNLSITTVLGGGGGGVFVRFGSSITVNGTFTLAGASASDIVDFRSYDLLGTTPLPWSVIKSSGIVNAVNARIAYSNASGGAKFQAFTANGCIDDGNNTGWVFSQSLGNFFVLL